MSSSSMTSRSTRRRHCLRAAPCKSSTSQPSSKTPSPSTSPLISPNRTTRRSACAYGRGPSQHRQVRTSPLTLSHPHHLTLTSLTITSHLLSPLRRTLPTAPSLVDTTRHPHRRQRAARTARCSYRSKYKRVIHLPTRCKSTRRAQSARGASTRQDSTRRRAPHSSYRINQYMRSGKEGTMERSFK